MNKRVHRLVFDRRRGMRVPAAEHVRSSGKAGGGQTRAVAMAVSLLVMGAGGELQAQTRADVSTGAVTTNRFLPAATSRSVGDLARAAITARNTVLPVLSTDAARTAGNTAGGFTVTEGGALMQVLQNGQSIVINWDSFNIGEGYTVQFVQPDKGRALNRIWDANPSVIMGRLSANGEILLENTNGVVFGSTARVDAGKLVATALKVTDEAFQKGIRTYRNGQESFKFDATNNNLEAFVSVERGAEIRALAGGDVMMIAPRVTNNGSIETPQGQTILAAGKTVYLYAPLDLAQRGLLVAVDGFGTTAPTGAPSDIGTVENLNRVFADKGTINLVGAAIRQKGTLSATTAVKGQNGAIFLQSMTDTVEVAADKSNARDGLGLKREAKTLGTVELGEGSVTQVLPTSEGTYVNSEGALAVFEKPKVPASPTLPSAPVLPGTDATDRQKSAYLVDKAAYDKALSTYGVDREAYDKAVAALAVYTAQTQNDADTMYRSRIDILGADITLRKNSLVQATGGEVNILAVETWSGSALQSDVNGAVQDKSHIVMEAGAQVDVSGLRGLHLPAERQQMMGRLFSIELADSPVQRGGVVYRSALLADARRVVTIGDVSGLYNDTRRTAAEYATLGGALRIQSQGAVLLDEAAKLTFGGGSVVFDEGEITSSLVRKGDQWVRIESARKDVVYDEFLSEGYTAKLSAQLVGMNGGAAVVSAPVLSLGAQLDGSVVMGEAQRVSSSPVPFEPGLSLLTGLDDQKDLNHELRRSTLLSSAPWLYASLRPRAGLLVVGNETGGSSPQDVNQITAVTVSNDAVPLPQVPAAWSDEAWSTLKAQLGGGTTLSLSKLNAARLGGLTLLADTVSLTGGSGATLRLTPGAALNITAFKGIQVGANVSAEGGAVSLKTTVSAESNGDITVAPNVGIDVRGTRRDERFTPFDPNEGVALNGGAITLDAARSVILANGSSLDVSAGVRRSEAGGAQTGSAGSISLKVNGVTQLREVLPGQLTLGGSLSGFDFNAGGGLSISGVPSIIIGAANPDASGLGLGTTVWAEQGFGKVTLSAFGDVTVAKGADVSPVLKNMVLAPVRQTNGEASLYKLQTFVAGLRQGVSLSLTAKSEPLPVDQAIANLSHGGTLTIGSGSTLNVGTRGSITLAAGNTMEVAGALLARAGTISLSLLGTRGARAGSSTGLESLGWQPEQAIHLASGSLLDVSGVAKTYLADVSPFVGDTPDGRNDLQQRSHDDSRNDQRVNGEVLAGGTVNLGAQAGGTTRGQFLMDPEATIKLSGAKGKIDRTRLNDRKQYAAAAGTLNVRNTDGFALAGTLHIDAPDASVSGAQVNVSISREGLVDLINTGNADAKAYPEAERVIRVLDSVAAVQSAAASNKEAASRGIGQGLMSTAFLSDAGIDRVSLRADNRIVLEPLFKPTESQVKAGVGVGLQSTAGLWQSLTLNTPILQSTDAFSHALKAQAITLGNVDVVARLDDKGKLTGVKPSTLSSAVLSGGATLNVDAGLISLVGDAAVQGFKATALSATMAADGSASRTDGEIRLINTSPINDKANAGAFTYAGDLSLTSGQLYATTLSRFGVNGLANTIGSATSKATLSVLAPASGSTSQLPLSAQGALSLSASTVNIDGRVVQPFGSIAIENADVLNLTDRALLSVTGAGLTVPVGTTLNGTDWYYSLDGVVNADGTKLDLSSASTTRVTQLKELPVVKSVTLNGQKLDIKSNSTVLAQAGGDLLAWEFKAGAGGSTDTYNRANVFAILPNYSYDFAPYDAEIMASTAAIGTSLKAGDQVQVVTPTSVNADGSKNIALEPGRYTLLPARYGLLPGAVLVSAVKLNTTSELPKSVLNDDKSEVVTGYRSSVGTRINGGNDGRLALVLEPEQTFRAKSEFIQTSLNDYVTRRADTLTNTARPGDAGRVTLYSDAAFNWNARYQLGANGTNFNGGQLELSSTVMDVHANDDSVTQGATNVSMTALAGTQAESILLGGKRKLDTGNIERLATTVNLLADANTPGGNVLSVTGELLAVAKDKVSAADGLTVQSLGQDTGASRSHRIDADGATLLVGNLQNTSVQVVGATGSATGGTLSLGSKTVDGKVTLAGAVVQLDATGTLAVEDGTVLASKAIGLGARTIGVGKSDDKDTSTLWLAGETLNKLNQSERLQLRSYSSIDLYGAATLGSDSMSLLTLNTPLLNGVNLSKGSVDQAVVKARDILSINSSGVAAIEKESEFGNSTLLMQATPQVADSRTGGITFGTSASAGQKLAFSDVQIKSTGDLIFTGTGTLNTTAGATLEAARVATKADANQTVNVNGKLVFAQAQGGLTQNESLGAGGKLTMKATQIAQGGNIQAESGTLSLEGSGVAGQTDTVSFLKGSVTSVAGRETKLNDSWSLATPGGVLNARAIKGDVVVDGLLDASSPALPKGNDGREAAAGKINLIATENTVAPDQSVTLGMVRMGANAAIKLNGGSQGATGLGGSLVVDTQVMRDDTLANADAVVQANQRAAAALDRLVAITQSANGNALSSFDVRVRASDLKLNSTLKADRINLTADKVVTKATTQTTPEEALGKIELGSDARLVSISEAGGLIKLNAGSDLTLGDGSQVFALSTRDGANGGDILLSSTGGQVLLGNTLVLANRPTALPDGFDATSELGQQISAVSTDTQDGRVVIRAQRDVTTAGAESGTMKVALLTKDDPVTTKVNEGSTPNISAGQLDLEGVRVYESATVNSLISGSTTSKVWGTDTISGHTSSFLSTANKANILKAAGLTGTAAHVKSGVEIRYTGTDVFNIGEITNGKDINLYSATRAGGEPIQLTVRAAGNIKVNVNVSDGFGTTARAITSTTTAPDLKAGDAASLRWVAGADSKSADLLAVTADNTTGNLQIAGGKQVRTTAGSIELAASSDVEFLTAAGLASGTGATGTTTNQASVYVAGRLADALATGETFTAGSNLAQFTERGGRLDVKAGRHVEALRTDGTSAQPLTQLPGNYFYHAASGGSQSSWWSAFDSFRLGLGSFGGGNLTVVAGGDVSNMSVVSPTNARYINTAKGGRALKVLGGGDVTVNATGNVVGGVYLLGRGQGTISAGEAIQAGTAFNTTVGQAGAILALIDGNWNLQSRTDLNVSQIYNPTLLPTPATNKKVADAVWGNFLTYTPDAGVSMVSTAGHVNWALNTASAAAIQQSASSLADEQVKMLGAFSSSQDITSVAYVAPSRISLVSHTGNVTTNSGTYPALVMAPSAHSDLSLYAGQNVEIKGGLFMLEDGQLALPTVASPGKSTASSSGNLNNLRQAFEKLKEADAYLGTGTQQSGNNDALQVKAGQDIKFTDLGSNKAALHLVRESVLDAGRDITAPWIVSQHADDTDVTKLVAGRDILLAPAATGNSHITLAGPGQLELLAGRELDLQNSVVGVQTVPNAASASPEAAAKVTLAAGMNGSLNLGKTLAAWGNEVGLRSNVLAAVQAQLPLPAGYVAWSDVSWDTTLALFTGLTPAHQVQAVQNFLTQQFVAEFLPEQASKDAAFYRSDAFQALKREAMWARINAFAGKAVSINPSADPVEEAKRTLQRKALFAQANRVADLAGLGQSFNFDGDVNLNRSKVQSKGVGGGAGTSAVDDTKGGTDVLTPGGAVLMGLPSAASDPRGFINYGGGSIRMLANGDVLATDQKVIVLQSGNIIVYTMNGSIDTGKASTTAIAVTPPTRRFNSKTGEVETVQQPTLVGSGFQVRGEGYIGLYAPNGEIRALDAPVIAPSVAVVANRIDGGDNIPNAVGLPVPTPPVINLSPAAKLVDTAAGVTAAADSGEGSKKAKQANSILTVELLSLGDEAGGLPPTAAGDTSPSTGDPKDKRRKDAEAK